jgi:RHS repeat-associated protein
MNSETDGSSYTYTYDREGRVTAQTGPSLTISYKYDALGRRIEQTVNGTVTKFVLDGDHVLADLNGSGTTIARYTNGPRVDEIISVRTGGQTYYYTQDALGSVVRILDQNRATKNTYEYLPWGEIYAQTEVIANRYTFTGRERNADGRTMHYRARGYLPHTGRFGQEDPLGFIDGINAYRYVRNSPCTFVDPSGLSCASGIGSLVFSTVGAVLSGVGFVISAGSEIATFGLSTPASVPGMAISAAGWSVSVGSMAFGIAEIAEECGKKKDAPEKEDK